MFTLLKQISYILFMLLLRLLSKPYTALSFCIASLVMLGLSSPAPKNEDGAAWIAKKDMIEMSSNIKSI